MKTNYIFTIANSKSSLAVNTKDQKSPEQWQALFEDMISREYYTHNQVYTDGSKKENLVGCGVWSKEFQLICELPQHATIFTAELHSIFMAINHIRNKPGRYIILTDSLKCHSCYTIISS